jgi:hypothetical protein
VVAGDIIQCATFAPAWDASGLTAGFDGLVAFNGSVFGGVIVVVLVVCTGCSKLSKLSFTYAL